MSSSIAPILQQTNEINKLLLNTPTLLTNNHILDLSATISRFVFSQDSFLLPFLAIASANIIDSADAPHIAQQAR
jgi:hypothetical protein